MTHGALTPRETITRADQEWRDIAAKTLDGAVDLISVSRFIPDSRVYADENKVAKIRRVESGHADNSLASSAEIMRQLGRTVDYWIDGEWEISVEDRVPGRAFSSHLMEQQDTKFTIGQRVAVLRRTAAAAKALHQAGVSHGDLRSDNILLVGDRVELIDFDRARRSPRFVAATRDWFGFGVTPYPFLKLVLLTLIPQLNTAPRKLLGLIRKPGLTLEPGASADLAGLDDAWRLARKSGANARGQNLAYYALTYRGAHFTGERAWNPRWEAIRAAVDFRGKTVLELGCNMGLLSTYAMLEGASAAHGVDHDQDIVEAARAASAALEAGSTFDQVDLMSSRRWEDELGGRDIVTALSVVHWVPDKQRVLDFLGGHDELIYEGHDTLDIETERLRAIGFTHIDVLMTTERDRQVLYARKR